MKIEQAIEFAETIIIAGKYSLKYEIMDIANRKAAFDNIEMLEAFLSEIRMNKYNEAIKSSENQKIGKKAQRKLDSEKN